LLPESVFRHSEFKALVFPEQYRGQQISGVKDSTTTKNTNAATFHENLLTIQNSADLEWPATDPANAGVRGEFCLVFFRPTTAETIPRLRQLHLRH
jgi:hypothetical protein